MKCKTRKTNVYWAAVLVIGFILFLLGLASQFSYIALAPGNDMFHGLLCGMGGGMFIVGIIMLVRNRLMSPQKRREEEIGMKDERNIAVYRAAMSVAYVGAMILFLVMVVAFIWLRFTVPALIAAGASVAVVIIFLVAYVVLNKKY
jgi:hypothetical protein